jgi:gamma-glutamyltranspeptidase/glutathione hydrolase
VERVALLRGRLLFVLCTCGLLLVKLPRAETKGAPGSRQVFTQQGVASESATAASDAMQVFARGGSAADAAIVAALVAGVTAPSSSGLGGGGFALGWDAAEGKPYCLDFREVAPAALERGPFEARPFAPEAMGRAVGVPGEARGLFALHRRAGRLAWPDLVRIAQRRAETGFSVSPFLATSLQRSQAKVVGRTALGFLLPGGKPALVGTRLANPYLARTLAALGSRGPDALYQGEIAEELVSTVRSNGGSMTVEDLSQYRVREREAIRVRYAGADVYTMPPPSAGGMLLAQVLTMFPPDELVRLGKDSAAYQHVLGEAMRGAFADRFRYLSDPDVSKVPMGMLLEPNRLERRRAAIAVDRTHRMPQFGGEEHGTHAIVTADRAGNVVSLTTTVNNAFGSGLVLEAAGIVLNDQLEDFATAESARPFGLTDSPNHPRPGARPVSSMTPTIVIEDGVPRLALGGSGGMRIATNVTQVLLDVLAFGLTPSEAVARARFSIPLGGGTLRLEGEASELHVRDLTWRGEVVGREARNATAVQVLAFEAGRVLGAGDARKSGTAVVR